MTTTINGKEVVIVEVPEGMTDCKLVQRTINWAYVGCRPVDAKSYQDAWVSEDLPPGFTHILLDTQSAEEKDYAGLVGRDEWGFMPHFTDPMEASVLAEHSFQTLLQSLSLDTSKRYLVISKMK